MVPVLVRLRLFFPARSVLTSDSRVVNDNDILFEMA